MVGKTLGPYEILERLGAGGMGEVYLARDSSLHRDVALKVLPPAFAADKQRLDRFQREARLLAGISHPNIATVHGLEHLDGVRFFVQELIDGDDLAARIKKGPIDLEEVLDYGQQIAGALESAHARGIVHRDLKPANIMVTADGIVKVLDFGLAKPVVAEEANDETSLGETTPTISRLKAEGVVLGTAAYMSPDQARGRNVDHRGDIWAFGCVLYEALVGRKAFEGSTLLDTLAAVVRAEPDYDALPARTPQRLRDLIRRCLRKRTRERLQHVGDARITLEEILAEPHREPAAAAVAEEPDRFTATGSVALAAALGGAVIGVLAWSALTPEPVRSPVHATLPFGGARMVVDAQTEIAVHPDGHTILYAAAGDGGQQLYRRDLDAFDPVPVVGTEGALNPFYSPDGDWFGFFADRQLKKMPVGGGAAFTICDVPVGSSGAVWLPDDTIIYATAGTGVGLQRVVAQGGEPEVLTMPNTEAGETAHEWPQALPGGDAILFTLVTATQGSAAILSLRDGTWQTLIEGVADVRYVPTGHLVFTRDGTLFAAPFDVGRRRVGTTHTPLVDGLFTSLNRSRAIYALSSTGALVYAPGEAGAAHDQLVWVDRQGQVEPLPLEPGSYGHPQLSPDGSLLAYDRAIDGRNDIWVYDLERRTSTRLTSEGNNLMPVWDPHGGTVLFASTRYGPASMHWRLADGSGEEGVGLIGEFAVFPRSWNPSGIAYYELNPRSGRDVWVLPGDGNEHVLNANAEELQVTEFNERAPAFSPNGRWVALVSDRSGRDEVYVRSYHGDDTQWTISNAGGTEPVWSDDGTELFYRRGDGIWAVAVNTEGAFFAGTPEFLFERRFKSEPLGGNQYYDVTANGQRFLMIDSGPAPRGPDRLHLILDFETELRSRMSGS